MLDGGPDPRTWMGNFERDMAEWLTHLHDWDMPWYLRWPIYSERLSKGAPVRCGLGVLDGDAHWRHLSYTTEPSVCCGDAALCQITLVTYLFSVDLYLQS